MDPALTRADGRGPRELRPVSVELGFQAAPEASCLIRVGGTRVVCAVSYEERLPRWKESGGWVTAEYRMLPGATSPRAVREGIPPGGRTAEIQRLVGRALRAVVDLDALPGCTLTVDCDVLDADGGTRTAAVTGGWVALAAALERLGLGHALRGQVAAVSVGVVDGAVLLDLSYEEDVRAAVDLNLVATADGRLVEVQGTAEGAPFSPAELTDMVALAVEGCQRLFAVQRAALEGAP